MMILDDRCFIFSETFVIWNRYQVIQKIEYNELIICRIRNKKKYFTYSSFVMALQAVAVISTFRTQTEALTIFFLAFCLFTSATCFYFRFRLFRQAGLSFSISTSLHSMLISFPSLHIRVILTRAWFRFIRFFFLISHFLH